MSTLRPEHNVVVAIAALVATHCASRPPSPTCAGAGSCAPGRSCLVGLCRPPSSDVVPPHSRRVVLGATQAVVLCSGATARTDATVVSFGAPSCRPTLLLRFDAPWGPDARVAAAFLVVGAAAGSPSIGSGTVVDVAAVRERWSPTTVAWRSPELGRAEATARAASPTGPLAHGVLRIDVTAIVAAWARRTLDDHGVAVTVAMGGEATLALATATSEAGPGPRLDVYLR